MLNKLRTTYDVFFKSLEAILDEDVDRIFMFKEETDCNNPEKNQDLLELTNDFWRFTPRVDRMPEPDEFFVNALNNGYFRDKDPNQLLMCAISVGSAKFLKIAIAKGANVRNQNFYMPKYNLYEDTTYLICTPLKHACISGDLDIIKLLLQYGADIFEYCEENVYSPLHLACHYGRTDIVKFLIENGADVNELSLYEQAPPIAFSVFRELNETSKLLIEYGANLDSRYGIYDDSLAHVAVRKDNYNLLEILLQNRFNPNIKDNDNNTVLHLAIMEERIDMVRLLVKFGADINIQNKSNENSIQLANRLQHYEIKSFLLLSSRSQKLSKILNRLK